MSVHVLLEGSAPDPKKEREVFGFWAGFCFTINTTMGSGFLTFPWAYQEGGWIMALAMQVCYCGLLLYLGYMLLDLLARCESITESIDAGMDVTPLHLSELLTHSDRYQLRPEIMPEVTSRKFDLSEAANIIFGGRARNIYLAGLSIYLGGALMSYTSIFASSMAQNIPVFGETCRIYDNEVFSPCWARYAFFVVLFAVPMLYFTISGFHEQLKLQATLTIGRVVVILSMILMSTIAILTHSSIEGDEYNPATLPVQANFRLSAVVMSIVMFAQLYHLQFPSIIEPIKDKTKVLPRLLLSSALMCTVLYTALGMVVSMAVPDISVASTLSFSKYCPGLPTTERPWWAYVIGYVISFFPAADVFSVFPILSVSLSDNWLSLYYNSKPTDEIPRRWYITFRVLTVLVPMLLATFLYQLNEILSFVGMIGVILTFMMIPLMSIGARAFIDVKSPFELRCMTPRVSLAIVILGALIVLYFFALYPY
jgi:amino acid permease